ncbi:MAG TPA: hypothetical protein VFH68_20770 [Polyangia bacterium]|nr:hypothetical protein [Polyangia bacterium]
MRLRSTVILGSLALLAGSTASSCAMLNNLQLPQGAAGLTITPPSITFSGATLVQSPSERLLAAYYCPELVSAPFGSAGVLCQGFFGRRPSPAEMSVAFDLRFHISNPNQIPIPLASVLTAATVFPAATNQQLGASCFQLCAPGNVGGGCGGSAAASACQASSRDVRSLNDFAGAAAGLLIAGGIAAATGQPFTFEAPRVSAAAELDVVVRFSFGPEPLLATLRQLALQSVNELKAGRSVSFRVPYRIEGTVWFDAGSFGRIAVGYGPLDGVWVLPTNGL